LPHFFLRGNAFRFSYIHNALDQGARNALTIASACACAGIVMGLISLNGLGLKFTAPVIRLSGDSLFIGLVVVMVTSLILGMGLPTPAAYLMVAIFGGPALIELGIQPLTAHMFCFFYAIISAITPPVALAAYSGAAIAGSDFTKPEWKRSGSAWSRSSCLSSLSMGRHSCSWAHPW